MFDLVIRNGTVLDGSGSARRVADVAVQDGRVAAVGPTPGKGRREIDAAVRPGTSPYLITLMEGVEDIPGTVLNEGVKFDWESFPDYLDTLASMSRAVDVAAQLPHGPLRFY